MKIILTKDVKDLGRAQSEVTVSDGYALNYLIPRKLAVLATPEVRERADIQKKQTSDRADLDAKLLAQNIASLAEATIVMKMKANEKGHLYHAVAEKDIVSAVKEQAHVDLPLQAIKLNEHIKEIGTFEIPVAMGEVFGKFRVTIEAE